MPMINGIKMACEPCIRGHRSTKCNHANDRLMVPVRKPGRPLSICPHPPNNPCSCGSVTAALPRTRKCGCGTGSGSKAGPSSTAAKSATRSPTKRTFFRPPTSPQSSTRPLDPNSLERTDANQMNIHAAPSNWSPATMPLPGQQNGNGNAYMLPPDALAYNSPPVFAAPNGAYQNGYHAQAPAGSHVYGNGEAQYNPYFSNGGMPLPLGQLPLPPGGQMDNLSLNMGQPMAVTHQQPPHQMNGMNGTNGAINGYRGVAYPGTEEAPTSAMAAAQAMPPPPTTAPVKGSCCSGGAEPANESPRHTPTSSTTSLNSNAGTAKSSCCSSPPRSSSSSAHTKKHEDKSDSTEQVPTSVSSAPSTEVDVKPSLSSLASPFSTNGQDSLQSTPVDPQLFTSFSQAQSSPAWYRYPAEYGTVSAPLQHSQWRNGLTVSVDPSLFEEDIQFRDPSLPSPFPAGEETLDNSHMCTCGDDCDCIGCVAHPYNNATRSTIQSAWTTMLDEASNGGGPKTTTTTSTTARSTAATPSATSPATLAHRPNGTTEATSSPQTHTPSDTSEDQTSLPAGDFLFVSYSVMGCSGEGLTCPCGDDCQCIGCTIHNNAPAA